MVFVVQAYSLQFLFRSAQNLNEVDICAVPRLSYLLLSPMFGSLRLPGLVTLRDRFVDVDIRQALRFRRVCPDLQELEVVAEKGVRGAVSTRAIDEKEEEEGPSEVRDRMKILSIKGNLGVADLPAFLSKFACIEVLRLENNNPNFKLKSSLESVNPAHLHTLQLSSTRPFDSTDSFRLSRFDKLVSLSLSGAFFDIRILHLLHRLPTLATLELGKNPIITLQSTSSLLSGSTKITSLKTIKILEGEIDEWKPYISSYNNPHHVFKLTNIDDLCMIFTPHGGEHPRFPTTFWREDLERFVVRAQGAGVEVLGELPRALNM